MSSKNIIHSAEVTSRQTNFKSRHLFFVIGLVVIVALAVTLIKTWSTSISEASSSESVVYSDALPMQYAQPWLDKAKAAVPPVHYSNALEMQYAQPWLDKQKVENAPAIEYSHALEMQYAQPWLDKLQGESCDGLRLDEMYACQYRNAQLQR